MAKIDTLPEVYVKNWKLSEKDPNLFVSTYLSPDLNKPLNLTFEQERFVKAMLSGNFDEGWFAGGNSSGKTWTAKFMAVMFGIYKLKPGKEKFSSHAEFLRAPYNILCTGPENKQAMELWQAIETGFQQSPLLRYYVEEIHTGTRRNTHPYIKLMEGTIIEAIGLQDKGKHIEGQAYDLILINEPPDVPHLIHCFEKVLVPRMWRRGGIICGFGTPKGKNDYYSLWRRGVKELEGLPNKFYEPRVYSQISDSRSNPYADQESIVKGMVGKNEDYISERIEGKFVDSKYSAFKDSDIEACIDPDLKNGIIPSTNHQFIHGLDFGRKGDYTVCITLDVSLRPATVVNIYRAGGGMVTWPTILADILNIYNKYNGEFFFDSTSSSGDIQTEWLADLGVFATPYQFGGSQGKKVALINNLQNYFGERKLKLPYNETLVDELRQYPITMEDKDISTDMVFGLALACWGARNYEPLGPIEILNK